LARLAGDVQVHDPVAHAKGFHLAGIGAHGGVAVLGKRLAGQQDKLLPAVPLVVLVDKGSASASEILSGAIQDNDRGTLVGTETFGKGLVQSVRGLSDGRSGLAITVAKYLTPNGRDINQSGIAPDVVIELTEEQREELASNNDEIGTSADPQYVRALDVLSEVIANGGSSRQAAQ
ncbi:MAG: hypothetical protein HC895_24550, partial [Leptolyngbyaceae cyanobacterium SM1_3_5]|nr:hypothetical protein [Leptolyngbyaceae cyanobacterium SM1_3_5]